MAVKDLNLIPQVGMVVLHNTHRRLHLNVVHLREEVLNITNDSVMLVLNALELGLEGLELW